MSGAVTFEVVPNEGQFGAGRMDWCLTVNGQLVSHCGLKPTLDRQLDRLEREAWIVLHGLDVVDVVEHSDALRL